MTEPTKRSSWFKYGCLGCLGLVAVGVVVSAVMVGLALIGANREQKFEPIDLTQQIDPTRVERIRPSESVAGASPIPSLVEVTEPGRITLDVSMSQFSLVPGRPGEPIRVEGRYDTEAYELQQNYEPYGERGWNYTLSFNRRGFNPFLVQNEGSSNRLRLFVPPDVPIVLDGKIGVGESEIELGGLWLVEVDLVVGIGEHELSFSDPLVAPMKRMQIDGSIGELSVLRLGNASPESFEIDQSIGETFVDLRGEWLNDATIDARCGIGACRLRLPRDVGVRMDNAGVMIGESNLRVLRDWPDPGPGRPTVTISITGKLGEVVIER